MGNARLMALGQSFDGFNSTLGIRHQGDMATNASTASDKLSERPSVEAVWSEKWPAYLHLLNIVSRRLRLTHSVLFIAGRTFGISAARWHAKSSLVLPSAPKKCMEETGTPGKGLPPTGHMNLSLGR